MPGPPASRLGDDAPDDESGASSAGPGAYGPPGRKNATVPLVGTDRNANDMFQAVVGSYGGGCMAVWLADRSIDLRFRIFFAADAWPADPEILRSESMQQPASSCSGAVSDLRCSVLQYCMMHAPGRI